MEQQTKTFRFDSSVPMQEVATTLKLARLATESLHGRDRVALDASCQFSADQHTVVIDIGSEAGQSLALIFLGYVRREFGPDAVHVLSPGAGTAAAELE